MSGNVLEWVSTIFAQDIYSYPYVPEDGREDLEVVASGRLLGRVLRGGRHNSDESSLRAAARNGTPADSAVINIGLAAQDNKPVPTQDLTVLPETVSPKDTAAIMPALTFAQNLDPARIQTLASTKAAPKLNLDAESLKTLAKADQELAKAIVAKDTNAIQANMVNTTQVAAKVAKVIFTAPQPGSLDSVEKLVDQLVQTGVLTQPKDSKATPQFTLNTQKLNDMP